jgi:hypothetical protein
VPAGVFYPDRRGMQGTKQQLQLLFQPEEMAPSLSPELRARTVELLSLMLRETARRGPSTNKEETDERQTSTDTPRT